MSKSDVPDPPESERSYYRNTMTGDRGYLVTYPDGELRMRYARGGGRATSGQADQIYNEVTRGNWTIDTDTRPAQPHQIAYVCFAADRALCGVIGLRAQAEAKWEDLKPETRRKWAKDGPTQHPMRKELWEAIMGVIGVLAYGDESSSKPVR